MTTTTTVSANSALATNEPTAKTIVPAAATQPAPVQPAGQTPTANPVNKPAFATKHNACSIAVYANPRKRDASIEYKFTLARSTRVKGQFKTSYSFRLQDTESLKFLIDQASTYITEQGIANAANDVRESEEV